MDFLPMYIDPDLRKLVEAALDQPRPTERLKFALNTVLRGIKHPVRPKNAREEIARATRP